MTSSKCEIIEPVEYCQSEDWASNPKPYVIVMVGLPGRGKSYITARLNRWINWKGIKCKTFALGEYRRKVYKSEKMDASWFDPDNPKQFEKREELVNHLVKDLKKWVLDQNGNIGIIDGTNTTRDRREKLTKLLSEFIDLDRILWIESVCELPDVVMENIIEVKAFNDDYKDIKDCNIPQVEPTGEGGLLSLVIRDFTERIEQYKKKYQPLDSIFDSKLKFIQMFNLGQRHILNLISGQLDQKILFFLMNLNPKNTTIYLCRHGESQAQIKKIIGTNADLTQRGEVFSFQLLDFIEKDTGDNTVDVYCSMLKRSQQTAKPFAKNSKKYSVRKWSELNEINGGHFEGMTYSEVENRWPEIYKTRQHNKYLYGWPGGESYRELVNRLEPIILEIEKSSKPMLIIAHQAVCRVLYAYLKHMLPEDCTDLDIKSHTVYKFTTKLNKSIVDCFDL